MRTCEYPGCHHKYRAKGYCRAHYYRERRGMPMDAPIVLHGPRRDLSVRDEQGRKECKTCREWLSERDFYKGAGSDGFGVSCFTCLKLNRYNLTKAEFKIIMRSQGWECAICHVSIFSVQQWDIDHDHKCCDGPRSCGKCVRGLLCSACNTGIGFLRDDPTIMKSAITYIERSRQNG